MLQTLLVYYKPTKEQILHDYVQSNKIKTD